MTHAEICTVYGNSIKEILWLQRCEITMESDTISCITDGGDV
jgi:hypothetical protein